MNLEKFDQFKLTLTEQDLKKRYTKVYGSVISNYFSFNKQLIPNTIEILKSQKQRQNLKVDIPSYQLAFLLSSSVQDTCLSVFKFYESVMKNTKIIKKLTENDPIKILCLESESLPTVIGICQVIDNMVRKFGGARNFDYSQVRVLIIDKKEDWRSLCGCIVDTVNCYFKNIELKLDFVYDSMNCFDVDLSQAVGAMDIIVVARVYTKYLFCLKNDCFLKTILREMKGDAIFFCFDYCNEIHYEQLKYLISDTNSFSLVNNSQAVDASFKDLENEEYNLDLPLNWDTSCQPTMFSTWIKNVIFKHSTDVNALDRLNPKSPTKNASNLNVSDLNNHSSTDKNTVKSSGCSSSNGIFLTHPETDITKLMNFLQIVNKPNITGKQSNSFNVKKKTNSSKPNSVGDEKIALSEKSNEPRIVNATDASKTVIKNQKKQKVGSKASKSKQKSQSLNVLSDDAISKSVIPKAENQVTSGNVLILGNSSLPQPVLPKKKSKAPISKDSNDSSTKISTPAKKTEANTSKQKKDGNMPIPVTKAAASQNEKPQNSSKNNSNSNSAAAKMNCEEKPGSKNTDNFPGTKKAQPKKPIKLTKKSIKNNATQKIKLTGKFAHLDLEKKNKDERHKMRAKQKSFSKYANFDYDD